MSADSIQINFTVTVGDTVVMPCPVPPGALMQYYSVEWMKDNNILICTNRSRDHIADPRYGIDGAYSLVISSVDVNDSSSSYECVLHSTNPITNVRQELQAYPERDILLTLHVLDTSTSTGKRELDTASTGEPADDDGFSKSYFLLDIINYAQ